jgi:hypothetical protein
VKIAKDLPLIRAMASRVIETEFSIKSSHTIWHEHLYELAGFKDLLGAVIVDRLKAKDATLAASDITQLPRISISIKNREAYTALSNLAIRNQSTVDGNIQLAVASQDGLIEIDLVLDFSNERIIFDIDSGLRISDDGSQRSAQQIISVLRFMNDYMGNGKLQIFNSDSGVLLGRKDAYIPMNIMPGPAIDHFNQLIAKYEAEAETRAAGTEQGAGGA